MTIIITMLASCLKKDIGVVHHNAHAHQPISVIFGRDVAESLLSNGDSLTRPPHLVDGLPEFSHLLLDLFNVADSQLIFMMPYDSMSLVL